MVPNGTFCEVSCSSSSSQLPTPFPSGAGFGSPPLRRVFVLQTALMWPMRPQRKHAVAVLPFPPPFVLSLIRSCRGLVKTFYNSPSSPSTSSSLLVSWLLASSFKFPIIIGAGPRVRLICAKSGNKCCCADNSLKISKTHGEESSKTHVFLQCAPGVFVRGFPKPQLCARRHPF